MKITLLVIVILVGTNLLSQEREERERPDPNDIRSFETLFSRAEHELSTAIQDHRQAAIANLLGPEFVLRDSTDASRIVRRETWLSQVATGRKILSFKQKDTIIRAFMTVAIVSFIEEQNLVGENGSYSQSTMVTDIWEVNRAKGKWVLAQRYSAPASECGSRQTPMSPVDRKSKNK